MYILKMVLAGLIAVMPLNVLRVLGYRLLGYRITGPTRIGFGTVIAVEQATLESCTIAPLNLFLGPMKLFVRHRAYIGNRNEFICGRWVLRDEYKHLDYKRTLDVGPDMVFTSRHYLDVVGLIKFGERCRVGGVGSQFWTHGAGVEEKDIIIGNDSFLGSAVRFSAGSSIGNNVIVAMGSVVSGHIDANRAFVGGVPAKVIKTDYDWKMGDAGP